ncbi:MAG: PASTA domain-containing protein, partial [Rubricoccaceae bacterium]|nr:PASTA domain-containing protein [Rubricoccaceae bacterium]
ASDEGWNPVSGQRPSGGETVRLRDAIRLTTEGSEAEAVDAEQAPSSHAVMPDLSGLSARRSVVWLASLGVDVRLQGSGSVFGQTPAAGSLLPDRAVLTLR